MKQIRCPKPSAIIKILIFTLVLFNALLVMAYIISLPMSQRDNTLPVSFHPFRPTGNKSTTEDGANFAKLSHRASKVVAGGDMHVLPSALLVKERPRSYDITKALEAAHIHFEAVTVKDRQWPELEQNGTGRFSVVTFQSVRSYTGLDRTLLQTLHRYCRKYTVGIVVFAVASEAGHSGQILDLPVYMERQGRLKHLAISQTAGDILHITKAGQRITGSLPQKDWAVFRTNHTFYRPVVQAESLNRAPSESPSEVLHTTMLLDQGLYDGIQRIFIGNNLRFWLHRVLFLDSAAYLSRGLLRKSLIRYIQVDIDDIFHAEIGGRMSPLDVEALLSEQQILAKRIPGFTFKLGFSGALFKQGTDEEQSGDASLVRNAGKFAWFPHMWAHAKAHTYSNQSRLIADMTKNLQFAQSHNISVVESYAVAPYHSGVYPVHTMLYNAWKQIWGIRVTSTEEYPALLPARKRRGFIFNDTMVLPRQTCGLYTSNVLMKYYPGGKGNLDASIYGGELFQTIINNPINIYMTHSGNYGSDRLALYTFDNVVGFVQKWTNLKLRAEPPLELAKKYFDMFPEERDPLWTNPCSYKRHLDILPKIQDCEKLPSLLVIGPQKTGSTALYTFLSTHPNILSNRPSKETYEEIQFFSNSTKYLKGLQWYIDFFLRVSNTLTDISFEKSATYFDSEKAPLRAHWLLPNAKLISILIDPAKRAYSWFQHEQANGNPASMNYTFYEVLTSGPDAPRQVATLRSRCLDPGKYVQHLQKWLQYYSPSQLMVVDGDLLKTDPVVVMWKIQQFLQVKNVIDYKRKLVYSRKKGYFCTVSKHGKTKCLDKNKGRAYRPMDANSAKYLNDFYQSFNTQLTAYLTRIEQPLPSWLNQT